MKRACNCLAGAPHSASTPAWSAAQSRAERYPSRARAMETMKTNAAGPVATSGESLRRARSGEGGSAPPTTHAPTSSLKLFSSRELSRNVLARMARISSRQARWSIGGPPRLTHCDGGQTAPPCEGAGAQRSWVFARRRICQNCARRNFTALQESNAHLH